MALVAFVGVLWVLPVIGRMTQTSEVSHVPAQSLQLRPLLRPLLARNSDALQVRPGAHARRAVANHARGGRPVAQSEAVQTPWISTPGKWTKAERMRSRYGGFGYVPEGGWDDGDFSYEDMQAELGDIPSFGRGDTVRGTIISFEPNGAFVDIGGKAAAFCANDHATLGKVSNTAEVFQIGEEYDFHVMSAMDADGMQRLSRRRILTEKAWEQVLDAYTADETVEATVVAVNRGGAMVTVYGLRAFLPGSQYMPGRQPDESIIGQPLNVQFLDADRTGNRIVVSHKKALAKEMAKIVHVGALLQGTVTAVKPYGVFVDLGGIAGLLHVSQISSDHVSNCGDIIPLGSQIKVMVITENKAKGQVGLSTKVLEPEPGDMIRNPAKVFAEAEATSAAYAERKAEEERRRAEAAEAFLADVSLFGAELVEGSPQDDSDPAPESPSDPGTMPEELLS